MAIKKSDLYSSIWKSCDELRGGMDASQYKDYVLVLLFVKYVTDKYKGQKDAMIEVPEGGSFDNLVALIGHKDIGDKMNMIIGELAKANGLQGVIDVTDFNDEEKLGKGKEMVERLSKLVAIFNKPELNFRGNRAEGDDLLGDAYEYLMRHFATESGKSKGQFYTPAEVSRVMAQVIGIREAKSSTQTIYDPTCGSGSLLLKAFDEAKSHTGVDLTLYGQEMDNATYALARMNMYLHGCETADIQKGNTLAAPAFTLDDGRLKLHDFIVANPPFSTKSWSNGIDTNNDFYGRFEFGAPPAKNGDYAFLLHILASLKSTGKGAVILPHGVLFRLNAEAEIRKNIIQRGYIKGIIGLPVNLFYGTSIPACIIVLDKESSRDRRGIFMIDASAGFVKEGNKNRLRTQDIHKIVTTFNNQIEIAKYSRWVPVEEINSNDYILNISRYIDSTKPEDLQDIAAHLLGGIPNSDIENLARYWEVLPHLKSTLFTSTDRPGYSKLNVEECEIKSIICDNTEFQEYYHLVTGLFTNWKRDHYDHFYEIQKGGSPKALISKLSESLLETFRTVPLIEAYDMYQHLMDYWAETMQDDLYLIVDVGWEQAVLPRKLVDTKERKNKDLPDFVLGKEKFKSELIPSSLLIEKYFSIEKASLDILEAELNTLEQQMELFVDEHEGEGGPLEDILDEKGQISKKSLLTRIKETTLDREAIEDNKVLIEYAALLERQNKIKGKLKRGRTELNSLLADRYNDLNENEIKTIVIENKWFAKLDAALQGELDRISQALTGRIKQLSERYAISLPQLSLEVAELTDRVEMHLKRMGFVWS